MKHLILTQTDPIYNGKLIKIEISVVEEKDQFEGVGVYPSFEETRLQLPIRTKDIIENKQSGILLYLISK